MEARPTTVVVVAGPTREDAARVLSGSGSDALVTSYADLVRDLPAEPSEVVVLDGEGAEHAVSALAHRLGTGLVLRLELGDDEESRARLDTLGRTLPELGVLGVRTWLDRRLLEVGWGPEGLHGPALASLVDLNRRSVESEQPKTPSTTPEAAVRPGLKGAARRLLPAAALVAVVAVAVLVVVAATLGATGTLVLLGLATVVLQAAVVAGVLQLWRELRTLRESHAGLETLVRRRTRRLVTQGVRSRKRDAALTRRVATLDRRTTLLVTEERRRDSRASAEQRRLHLTTRRQQQAWDNLLEVIEVGAAAPLAGGWAASPDLLLRLVEELLTLRPRLVTECGSGLSTLVLALASEQHGLPTRIVSLEHSEEYAAATRALLARHGVAHRVEVRLARLVRSSMPDHDTAWYDEEAVADLTGVGLLFIDGPPESTGPMVRYPAVPLLRDRLAPECTIVLDDAGRDDEREAVRRWAELLPDFTLEHLRELDKPAAVLSRRT